MSSEPQDLRDLLQSSLGTGYRLSRELGGGGMAKVFVADDGGRRVVVKVLSPDLAAGVNLERFKREIQLAAKLHHPHIVPVLGAGQSGDQLMYYTMPFIEGETLRALVTREQRLDVDHALAIAGDVASALSYAHQLNIVHRDIKPENILIEKASGHALVTDFGIARAIEKAADIQSVTSTGLTLGTPTYMSPEQAAADRNIDGRSDIYSLGCVLYEMLSGDPPFTGPTARGIIARHMKEAPPPIRHVRSDLPASVQHVLDRMLAKPPEDRFQSADELGRALANPAAAVDAARKPQRAGITRTVLGAALALLALIVILIAVWALRGGVSGS
jgi:serine/threonine-protein kinase